MAKWTFDSSNIDAIDYLPDLHILLVFFKNSNVYEYQEVPPSVNQAFRDAPSAGKFYARDIKGKYEGRKISDVGI